MSGRRERLAERRKRAGYTQETLAAEVGVDRRTVARWEDGAVDPRPEHRKQLAAALGLSMDELADDLHAESGASGHQQHSPAEVGTSFILVPPVAHAEDVASSRGARWIHQHTRLTRLAVAGVVAAAAVGLIQLLLPEREVSTPLIALHSGRCVSVTGDVMAEGAKATQHACTGVPGRTWHLERVGKGSADPAVFRIVGVNSGRCLTFSEERIGGARVIVQQLCRAALEIQEWRFIIEEQRDGFSYGQLINMGQGSCLDINGGSVDAAAPVVLWICGEQRNQRFGVAGEAVS